VAVEVELATEGGEEGNPLVVVGVSQLQRDRNMVLHIDSGVGGRDDGGTFTRSERGGDVGILGARGYSRGCRRGRHGGRWSGGLRGDG